MRNYPFIGGFLSVILKECVCRFWTVSELPRSDNQIRVLPLKSEWKKRGWFPVQGGLLEYELQVLQVLLGKDPLLYSHVWYAAVKN